MIFSALSADLRLIETLYQVYMQTINDSHLVTRSLVHIGQVIGHQHLSCSMNPPLLRQRWLLGFPLMWETAALFQYHCEIDQHSKPKCWGDEERCDGRGGVRMEYVGTWLRPCKGMFSLFYGLYQYLSRKEEIRILILGIDRSGGSDAMQPRLAWWPSAYSWLIAPRAWSKAIDYLLTPAFKDILEAICLIMASCSPVNLWGSQGSFPVTTSS